jgi:protocatechuate 3,4-dioxygenase beta subunit
MNRRTLLTVAAAAAAAASAVLIDLPASAQSTGLAPMQEHPLARQNYVPGAPLRASVGRGKVITGVVRSTIDGAALPGATVEFWLNTTDNGGDEGERNPANRGRVSTDAEGRFRFETDPPARVWSNAAPHVHTRVTAAGYEPFFYRHITDASVPIENVSIVLVPARND